MQAVSQMDDLFPINSEDSTTQIQLPRSRDLQGHGVTLTLSLDPDYEYKVLTHTADELRELSPITSRMEYNNLSVFENMVEFEVSDHLEVEMFHQYIQMLASHRTNKYK